MRMTTSQPAKILVVDDDPDVLFATAKILRKAGYIIYEASTGNECLKKTAEHKPDIILLDVVLPDIQGTRLCRQIKKDADCKGMFVILISGEMIASAEQANGLDHGADGYIARPISNRELVSRVRAIERILIAERKVEHLVVELTNALSQVKTLRGLLPICSHCKKIRDDKGYWNEIETYLDEYTDAKFSHGICQDCAKKHYPNLNLYED